MDTSSVSWPMLSDRLQAVTIGALQLAGTCWHGLRVIKGPLLRAQQYLADVKPANTYERGEDMGTINLNNSLNSSPYKLHILLCHAILEEYYNMVRLSQNP